MLRSLFYFLKLSAYWMLFFTLYRILFLFIYPSHIPRGEFSELLKLFFYAVPLDVATIGHLIFFPFTFWALQQFTKTNLLNHLNHIYNILLIICTTLLSISTIAMYDNWGAPFNQYHLHYLFSPSKIFPYLNTWGLIIVSTGAAAIIAIFIYLFRLLILMVIPYATENKFIKAIALAASFPVLIFMMRGGLNSNSINEESACFSKTKFFNHVAVNPVWHLSHMAALAIEEYTKLDPEKK